MKIRQIIVFIFLSICLSANAMDKDQSGSVHKIDEFIELIFEKDIHGIKTYLAKIDDPKSFLSQPLSVVGKTFTPIQIAIFNKSPNTVKALIDAGADVNFSLPGDSLPLHDAVASKDPQIVDYLLKAGANPDIKDEYGTPLLNYAVGMRESKIINHLLESGAKIDLQDNNGVTALMVATSQGNLPLVQKLLEAGANPALRTVGNTSALSLAQQRGFTDIAKLLKHYLDLQYVLQNE